MSIKISSIKPNLKEVSIGRKNFTTPVFFPSISSYGLKIPIEFTTNIINVSSFPRVLISSYDLIKDYKLKDRNLAFLDGYLKNNLLFVDSGCYESYNFKDNEWKFENYLEVVKDNRYDIYTTFDVYPSQEDGFDSHVHNTLETITQSNIHEKNKLMIPILHEYSQEKLIELLKSFLTSYPNKINAIAFSEKELGFNILTILTTISKIKRILDEYDENVILHILGCGDPKSILLYIYFGVDSFDSRDWSKRAMNRNSLLTYPISQLDFFGCNCDACSRKYLNECDKLLLHNLLFYESFMSKLKDWLLEKSYVEQLNNFFELEFLEKIEKIKQT